MQHRRRPAKNRRRKKGDKPPVLLLLAVVVLMVLAGVSYVAWERTQQQPAVSRKPPAAEKQKMPHRTSGRDAVQDEYSAAVVTPPETMHPQRRLKVKHRTVAVIIDDMGSSMREADALLAIGVPVTFSIIPGLGKVREVAEAAHRRGGEVMLHIPMEPKDFQDKPFEKNGLLLSMSDDETRKRVQVYLAAVPHAVGANNHMGSRYTEDRAKMLTVLQVLKGKGLFFVDSKTSSASVADRVAREMGLPTASRNVFLDNEQTVGAIRIQLEKLAAMADKHGSAIGICHPHKATLQALAENLPALKAGGVNFVHASALVH